MNSELCLIDTYENALSVIFDQWPKLCLGFDVEPEIRILKVIYYISQVKEALHNQAEALGSKNSNQRSLEFFPNSSRLMLPSAYLSEKIPTGKTKGN